MNKHTPGPWEIRGFHGAVEKIGPVNDKDVTVAMMPHWDTHIPEKLANARLIALAPTMLEFIENADCHCEESLPTNDVSPPGYVCDRCGILALARG